MTRSRTVSLTIGSMALGAVLATGLTGLAQADDSVNPDQPAASGQAGTAADGQRARGMHDGPGRDGMPGKRGMRGPGGDALHGELVVKAEDGTISTVRQVRGEVTQVSSTAITVEAEDGYTATFAVTEDTVVRAGLPDRDGERGEASTDTIADVEVGDLARVHGTVSGSTATAERIMAMSADEAAQLEELRQQREQQRRPGVGGAASGTVQS